MVTRVFLDTEFLDDGHRIDPVSIALVAETGAEYYAVFADCDLSRVIAHPWLRHNVVPHLPARAGDSGWCWDASHPDFARVQDRAEIAAGVREFLTALDNPEIWAYFTPFDTIVLCQLYGPMSDLPPEIPGFTSDLRQEARRAGTLLPAQAPPVHHALSDARHDLAIATAIGLITPSGAARRPDTMAVLTTTGHRR
jgi:3' exoribonuclease, RNase T-like